MAITSPCRSYGGSFSCPRAVKGWSVDCGRVLEREDEGGRYSALWDLARSKHVPIQIAHTVQQAPRCEIEMFRYSTQTTGESIHLIVAMKKVSSWKSRIDHHKVLLTGDIEEDAERHLLDKVSDVDLLKWHIMGLDHLHQVT